MSKDRNYSCSKSLPQCKFARTKSFKWNPEKPRQNSEYLDKKYDKAFNNVGMELKVIGGLGKYRCMRKNYRQPLINRPTQAQTISHTKTKFLPNFSLTDELKPHVVCEDESMNIKSIEKHVEDIQVADNHPKIQSVEKIGTNNNFNHKNPFNLDLNALTNYQHEMHDAQYLWMRRKNQIIRRKMETLELLKHGTDRIVQEERNEKYQMPKLFVIEDAGRQVFSCSPVLYSFLYFPL
jgi:hypothetical protein